MIYQHEA